MKILAKITFLTLFVLLASLSYGQFSVNSLVNLNTLVSGFVGTGITITNVSAKGDTAQIGYFSGNTGMGINTGVILSSGRVGDANGVNLSGSTSFDFFGLGDADLELVTGIAPTYDAASIEIDFIASGDTIVFNYVFASEEFPEWVGTGYNDAFAFIIIDSAGNKQNIALIPNTTLPVSIDNVNDSTNSSYYVPNTSPSLVEYDGYTVPLTATVALTPNQPYTLKVVVADVLDFIFDSAVFLEFGSFSSNGGSNSPTVAAFATTSGASGEMQEGCSNGMFSFVMSDSLTTDTTIYFQLSGTAQNGSDYVFVADSIIIPAGQLFANINILPLSDTLAEGTETVSLTYTTSTGLNTLTLNLNDGSAPLLSFIDTTICEGTSYAFGTSFYHASGTYTHVFKTWQGCDSMVILNLLVNPIITISDTIITDSVGATLGSIDITLAGGTAPYSYEWSNGAVTEDVNGLAQGFYSVVITDAAGCSYFFGFEVGTVAAHSVTARGFAATAYPNPLTGKQTLWLEIHSTTNLNLDIVGFDVVGREVFRLSNQSIGTGNQTFQIPAFEYRGIMNLVLYHKGEVAQMLRTIITD